MSRPDKRTFQQTILGTAKEEGGARLFAFANARHGYQVVFSPERPLVVLRTKKSAVADQHPCLQWEPLSQVVFERRPTTTHALFVLDAAPSSDAASTLEPEQEELSVGASIGGPLKRVVNLFTRLNPHNGTLIAAGVSAIVAFKYVLIGEKTLGHRDRLLQHVILVCPGPVEAFKQLGTAIQRRNQAQRDRDDYPLPTITVLVKAEHAASQGAKWLDWLQTVSCSATSPGIANTSSKTTAPRTPSTLFDSARVVCDLSPSLFAAIASAAGIEADGSVVDPNTHLDTPEVYRIAFALSRATKTIEQFPLLAPLNTPGYEELDESHHHHHDHNHSHDHAHHGCGGECEDEHEHEHEHTAADAAMHDEEELEDGDAEVNDGDGGSTLVAGLSSLPFCRDPVRIVLEGRVLNLDEQLIGTTEGVVRVSGMDALIASDAALKRHVESKRKVGAPVFVSGSLQRDARGRTTLRALEMEPMTKMDVKQSVTVGDTLADIPVSYNVSNIAHSYGAVLIRGRKCALVRSSTTSSSSRKKKSGGLSGGAALETMRLPAAPHTETKLNAVECATEALCQSCEVSADNFYFPNYLSPFTYYVPASDTATSAGAADGAVMCVTLYTALAVNPPPRGAASDAVEDAPEPREPYDWVSFDRALRLLGSEAERTALQAVQKHLASAAAVGLYTPVKGCGVFGDRVAPLPGDVAGSAVASAGAAPSSRPPSCTSLQGMSVMVLFCPGAPSSDSVRALTRAVFPDAPFISFDLYTTKAMLLDALQQQYQRQQQKHAATPFLLHVADDVDVTLFCSERLVPLSEDLGADVSVFTLLTTDAASRLFVMPAKTARDESERESEEQSAAAGRDRLLTCASASDAVITVEANVNAFSQAVWAALALCGEANHDATLVAGLEARRPLDGVCERVFAPQRTMNVASELVLHRMERRTTTPLAPAALHFLTQADSLSRMYMVQDGGLQAVLVLVSADAWVATRAAQQARITLDADNRCLEITPGMPWEGPEETKDENNAPRASTWCVVAQISLRQSSSRVQDADVKAMCAKLDAVVTEMVHQVEYNAARDGENYQTIHDPLPAWDEGWDDACEEDSDCHGGCCGGGCSHDHH